MKVCRNTSLVFSPYDDGGMNKVRCAFLGVFDVPFNDGSFRRSSCEAKTRYEFDSQSPLDLALTKGRYHLGEDEAWEDSTQGKRRYIDSRIASAYNSYDSLDKYVMVMDIQSPLDVKGVFDAGWETSVVSSVYNILGDAGCIPHFAYQSLMGYGSEDKDAGTAYTYRNKYLITKEHMQFELLGLDDKSIPEAFETMQKMVVQDLEDDCRTLLAPARMMEDIYRIWCENKTFKARPSDQYDSYFDNEWREYVNNEFSFNDEGTYEWDISTTHSEDDDLIQLEIDNGMTQEDIVRILENYYVYVFRTEDGEI